MAHIFDIIKLSGGAHETLRCLFFHGPTMDGNIPSKCGRDELIKAGLAKRTNGHAYLTDSGMQYSMLSDLDKAKDSWQHECARRGSIS